MTQTTVLKRFIPLTLQMGFLEADFRRVCSAYLKWQGELLADCGGVEIQETDEGLHALERLQPLTTPQNQTLLLETNSRWTAFFVNGLRTSDPGSPVGYLCTIMPCKGVVVYCVPDRSNTSPPKTLRKYGAVMFTIYSPNKTDWMNRERSIGVMNDGERWRFWENGVEQTFEETDRYSSTKVRDRFTCEMLERYCVAMGIRPFEESFYGKKGLVVRLSNQWSPGDPSMTLEEARRLVLDDPSVG